MLTEAEKKWLGGKSEEDYPAPCVRTGKRGLFDMRYCLKACEDNSASSPKYCPIASDFRDVAEFEARVAARLAETAGDIALLLKQAGLEQLSDWQLLRIARLAVEEEMQ